MQLHRVWELVLKWMLWTMHIILRILRRATRGFSYLTTPSHVELKKVPKSIGIAFDSELARTMDVVRVLQCCASYNLQDVLLYDIQGSMVKNHEAIALLFSKSHNGLVNLRVGSRTYAAAKGFIVKDDKRAESVGSIRVEFMSSEISNEIVTKELRKYCSNEGPTERKKPFHIGTKQGRHDTTDLLVTIGGHFSVKGFPSWLVGPAELGHIQSLEDINTDFARILRVYNESVQRHGA